MARSRSEGVRSGLGQPLEVRCARALYQCAREAGAGTRQQLRAAARRFVRRYHRDEAYLRWVLRSGARSSALAVALLGLGAAPAEASFAPFADQTGAANPLDGYDLGNYAGPSLGDLDGDGDLDVIAGAQDVSFDGSFFYFENTGSVSSPAYVERTGSANPLDGQIVDSIAAVALGDLDTDGDLDLVAGDYNGVLRYFENTGSAVSPAFVLVTGAGSPVAGLDIGQHAVPSLGDLDGDGDLDMVVGELYGGFLYFENAGTAVSPAFVEHTGGSNPLDGVDLGQKVRPALGDLDSDGDLDLVAGEFLGMFFTFENTGTATTPSFAARTGSANPLAGYDIGNSASPSLGDLDSDGDLDLIAGERFGPFYFFVGLGGATVPSAFELTGAANPLDGQDGDILAIPAFGDLDSDGDLDLISGDYNGGFNHFENTGDVVSPAFLERTGLANVLVSVDIGLHAAPALGDLDGDGDLDLVAGEFYGVFYYFENTGTALSPAFVELSGGSNPLNVEDVGLQAHPALGDLDGDGDLDLLAGEFYGGFAYFENTGDATLPAFAARTGAANPLDGEDLGYRTSPALADFDGDGDLDVVVGESGGTYHYYENQGDASNPIFVERTGAANPLDGQDAGANSAPVGGDLDGDGDFDVVAGEQTGTFHTYYFPEPARALLLGAGIGLLSLLERLRRRER